MPKTRDGPIEMIRSLQAVRRSALKARTQAANQLQGLVITAPDVLRGDLRGASLLQLVAKAAAFRVSLPPTTPTAATKFAIPWRGGCMRVRLLSSKLTGRNRRIAVDEESRTVSMQKPRRGRYWPGPPRHSRGLAPAPWRWCARCASLGSRRSKRVRRKSTATASVCGRPAGLISATTRRSTPGQPGHATERGATAAQPRPSGLVRRTCRAGEPGRPAIRRSCCLVIWTGSSASLPRFCSLSR